MAAKYPAISAQLFREIIRCGVQKMYSPEYATKADKIIHAEFLFQSAIRGTTIEEIEASIVQSVCNTRSPKLALKAYSPETEIVSINTNAAEGTEYLHLQYGANTPQKLQAEANKNMPVIGKVDLSNLSGPNLADILKLASAKAASVNSTDVPTVSQLDAIFGESLPDGTSI